MQVYFVQIFEKLFRFSFTRIQKINNYLGIGIGTYLLIILFYNLKHKNSNVCSWVTKIIQHSYTYTILKTQMFSKRQIIFQ